MTNVERGAKASRIAIVGRFPGSIFYAPCDDPRWEIWGVGPGAFGVLPRLDAWFELHNWQDFEQKFTTEIVREEDGLSYRDWLIDQPRVYIQGNGDEFPGALAFPFAGMVQTYGPYHFSCSVAWMMAMALSLTPAPEAIGLWGVEMRGTDEYFHQRAGFHHFVQIAYDKGIDICIPEGSTLLDVELYANPSI